MLRIAIGIGSICVLAVVVGCVKSDGRRGEWARVHPGETADSEEAMGQRSNEPGQRGSGGLESGVIRPSTPGSTPGVASNRAQGEWVRLNEWARSELGTTPRRIAVGGGMGYSLETALGTLVLTPATRLASFDGVTFWLGFAPMWLDGDCMVHELDLRKNVIPLLTQPEASSMPPRTIVIDPGHGGQNHGTRSVVPGLLEKDLTLDWALRMEPLLKRQGWNVVLTRRDDRDMSLPERVEVADRCQADLFLSLHFNSALPQTEQCGLETFCTTPVGLPSTLTRNYEDDVTHVFPNNSHDADNLRYAIRLHRSLLQAVGMADRSVRRARFMGVLRTQQRPAVLLEGGYLSNPQEARCAATPEYRQRLAEAVADCLAPPSTVAAGPLAGRSKMHAGK